MAETGLLVLQAKRRDRAVGKQPLSLFSSTCSSFFHPSRLLAAMCGTIYADRQLYSTDPASVCVDPCKDPPWPTAEPDCSNNSSAFASWLAPRSPPSQHLTRRFLVVASNLQGCLDHVPNDSGSF
ncbi:hypothetical protein BDZ85DRAFT_262497 [Elsinoe ampelina]|uniref:Uncharacterized protein n=1 Tax=Elsinoe ampelina TaxID=302913 RepID=A0A6A6GAS7_9PEZI|nr:hypothetical protein BDZ85DRAFT_262497 [Elsinoe ampelina]